MSVFKETFYHGGQVYRFRRGPSRSYGVMLIGFVYTIM